MSSSSVLDIFCITCFLWYFSFSFTLSLILSFTLSFSLFVTFVCTHSNEKMKPRNWLLARMLNSVSPGNSCHLDLRSIASTVSSDCISTLTNPYATEHAQNYHYYGNHNVTNTYGQKQFTTASDYGSIVHLVSWSSRSVNSSSQLPRTCLLILTS